MLTSAFCFRLEAMIAQPRGEDVYVFAGCTNPACRFRFPVEASDARRLACPRCASPTELTLPAVPESIVADAAPHGTTLVAVLDNIRSTHNAGSMFRTADGAGLAHLYLCGITATPDHPKLAKAALGTERTVPWSYSPNGAETVERLAAEGHALWALERLAGKGRPLFGLALPKRPVALVVGNEKAGVDPAILGLCDEVVHLPMGGRKTSLNAAVAFGIAVYTLRYAQPVAAAGER